MSCLLQLFSNNLEYSLLFPCCSNVVGTLQPFVIRSHMFPLLFLVKIIKLKVALIDVGRKRTDKEKQNKKFQLIFVIDYISHSAENAKFPTMLHFFALF